MSVEFLHAMVRVGDLPAALKFFTEGLGLVEVRRNDYPQGKYTLVFLASPDDIKRANYDGTERLPPGVPMESVTNPRRVSCRAKSRCVLFVLSPTLVSGS